MMARKRSGIPSAGAPPVTDDFSLIKGIGPVLSGRLHQARICTYSELASLSPGELAQKVNGLSAKQIALQDWIGQAQRLAPPKTRSQAHPREPVNRTLRQHYVNFTIEFLLDEKNKMRRTRAVHVQSGDADTWTAWEPDQLLDFLARHAGVHIPPRRLEHPEHVTVCRQSPTNANNGPGSVEVRRPDPLPQIFDVRETSQPSPLMTQSALQAQSNTSFTGILRLQDFKILALGSETPIHSLRQDQPWRARLTLDLTNTAIPGDVPLKYKATINFKQMAGATYPVGEGSSTIRLSECATVGIVCTSPPPGLYRPVALVRLYSDETDLGLMASLKGNLIQVY